MRDPACKNRTTVVVCILVGEDPGKCRKSRVWSSAIMIMMRPRAMSIEWMRCFICLLILKQELVVELREKIRMII
jgi:hypothetical protein